MAKKTFEKQLLRYGQWKHPSAPGGKLSITKDYVQKIVSNFTRTPFAPVIRGHNEPEAEKNPALIVSKNIKGLEVKEDGLYGKFDMDESEIEKYNDVSVSIEPEYEDHESGKLLGPVLKHVALVVNPYIKGLNSFKEAMALGDDKKSVVIYLSEISNMPEEKEIVTEDEVKEEVEETVAETTDEATTEEATEAVAEETTEEAVVETLPVDASETQDELTQLRQEIAQLQAEKNEREAASKVDALLSEGKILPKQKEIVKALYMAGNTEINLAEGKKTVDVLLGELFKMAPTLVNLKENVVTVTEEIAPAGVNDTLLSELRKEHPEMDDAQFNEYVQKNKGVIEKYSKKQDVN